MPISAAAVAPGWLAAGNGYVRLIRFHYHCSFAVVILGALTVARGLPGGGLVLELAALYLVFNLLLYGGLYTINGVADALEDHAHVRKRHRPIASGQVSAHSGMQAAAVLLALAFAAGFLLWGPGMMWFFAGFTGLNLIYTFWAKQMTFAELALNAATYPLRFMLGAWMAGGAVSAYLIGIVYLTAFGACTARRSVEGSPRYSRAVLWLLEYSALGGILALRLLDRTNPNFFYYCGAAAFIALVFGVEYVPVLRAWWWRFWTR